MSRIPDRPLRYAVAALIIGALVLCIGTLAYFPVPRDNRDLLVALTTALTLLARDAARWVFPTREPHQEQN